MKKLKLALAITIAAGCAANAMAYEAGDLIVRVGAVTVDPDGDGADLTAILGVPAQLTVDDDTQVGINGTYMLTNNIGIEVLAATPFTHDIAVNGAVIAETKHLPPTVTAQYHFDLGSNLHPFVGVGVNYTNFFEEKLYAVGDELELDDSFGLALEAGVDYAIDDNWMVSAQVWYIDIDTSATIRAGGVDVASFDVEIDPLVYMVGVGYKF